MASKKPKNPSPAKTAGVAAKAGALAGGRGKGVVPRVHFAKPRQRANQNDVIFSPGYTVTSTTDGRGRLLKDVEVICCFWGRFWTRSAPAPSPSAGDYALAIQAMLSGTYMSRLGQYRGINKGSLAYCDFNDTSDPADLYTNADVIAMLKGRFQNTNMPNPATGHDRFYAVIVPPGIRNSLTQYAGEHGSFDYNGSKAYFAWVGNTGSLTGHDCVTKVFSHELTEACTDPDVDNGNGYGILVNGTQAGGALVKNDEIGDTCNNQYATVNMNGISCTVQSYWSKEDNACVLPVSPPKNAALDIVAVRKVYSRSLRLDYISRVKAQDAAGLVYWLFRSEVIDAISSNGNRFFVNGDDGTRSEVMIESHYIRTRPDASKRDNLLSLPAF
jgi:hypothetical protein